MAKTRSLIRTAIVTRFGIGLVALLPSLACTAILAPRDDVERCGSADDCPATGDNRYVAECRFDPGSSLDSTDVDKVCVAAFKPGVSCNPMNYVGQGDAHPFVAALDDLGSATRYTSCTENPGVRGCPPEAGVGCGSGLVLRADNVCDTEESPRTPAIDALSSDAVGQDVLDQFCRSFFCDNSFVCDTTDDTCVKCDPNESFAEGGCGTIFVAGAQSCAYTSDIDAVCDGPDASADEPKFGTCS